MIKKLSKCSNGLKGEITIPADKSVSHRAVMFSSISKGSAIIKNFSGGADCHSTLNLFKQLGVDISFIDDKTLSIASDGKLSASLDSLDCGNSGTTMRLVSGILAGQEFNSTLAGDTSLTKRPMRRVIEPLSLMGAKIESNDGHAPLKIYGEKLHGINFQSKLASAQVKSCVLLAGLNACGETEYTEPFVSRNHTEILLKYLGADIKTKDKTVILSPSELEAKDILIVGDISSAAFFIVAGLIVPKSDLIIKNVGLNPTRTGIIDVVQRMGGNIEILNKTVESGEQVGDIRVRYTGELKGCTICGEDIPRLIDELPVIAVLASQAEGKTLVKDAQDLRNKESDRIKCLAAELSKLGIDIEETEDGFVINSKQDNSIRKYNNGIKGGALVESYHDHRLAMSYYVAGLIAEKEVLINGFEWTKISFPEFEELMGKII